MALDLTIFLIFLGASVLLYLCGMVFKIPHLFMFGCVLLFGAGALLYGANGLITGNYYDVDGVLAQTVVPMSDIGLTVFAIILVVIPVISFLVIDFNPGHARSISPFHY